MSRFPRPVHWLATLNPTRTWCGWWIHGTVSLRDRQTRPESDALRRQTVCAVTRDPEMVTCAACLRDGPLPPHPMQRVLDVDPLPREAQCRGCGRTLGRPADTPEDDPDQCNHCLLTERTL